MCEYVSVCMMYVAINMNAYIRSRVCASVSACMQAIVNTHAQGKEIGFKEYFPARI